MPTRLVFVLLVVLVAAHVSRADELYDELDRGVDVTSEAAVTAAHEALLEADAAYPEKPLRRGALRVALAQRLTESDVRALLAAPLARDDEEAARAVLSNLTPRLDLATDVLAVAGWRVWLSSEDAIRDLVHVACNGVGIERPDLALALLADERATLRMAAGLSEMRDPRGLRLLVDVVLDAGAPGESVRALLAGFEPDTWNYRPDRPLGETRADGLVRLAGEDPDPAMRVLAARLLLRSGAGDLGARTVEAFRRAGSWRVEDEVWEEIARRFDVTPAQARTIPDRAWCTWLSGVVVLSHVRAGEDEVAAADLMAFTSDAWRRIEDPRRAGLFLRELDSFTYAFVDWGGSPARPLDPYAAFLTDLVATPPDRPAAVSSLAKRVGKMLSRALVAERTPHEARAPTVPPADAAGPVYGLLPEAGASYAAAGAIDVPTWLELDPFHLFDSAILYRMGTWSDAVRARVLDAYPPGMIAGWLARPPSRYRVPGTLRHASDAVGAENRERLMKLLAVTPGHRDRLLDAEGIETWPARNRFLLGRLLHAQDDPDRARLAARLADDVVAAGYCAAALESPRGVDDLSFAADVVTGTGGREGARDVLVDAEEFGPSDRLGPRDEWPELRVALDAARRTRLADTLGRAVDPWVARLAGRILAFGATTEDLAVLLSPAGDRLAAGALRNSHPLSDVAYLVHTPAQLELALSFLEDARIAARTRVDFLEGLLLDSFANPEEEPDPLDERPEEMRARLLVWIATRLPLLEADVAEGLLLQVEDWAPDDEVEGEELRALRRAVEGLPAGAVRLRMARLLAARDS